ncbi:hypothetical protein BD779DRAFT_1476584 [Infundibulicybe gibba]|nr:hypothetical protein BD779DRAFT_1476584 [Infundibulicybe gibba]
MPGMGIRALVLPEWSAWAWVGVNHWEELAALAFYEVDGGAMIVASARSHIVYVVASHHLHPYNAQAHTAIDGLDIAHLGCRALYKLFQRSGLSHPCSTPSNYSHLAWHVAYLDIHTWVAHGLPHAPALHCTLPPPNCNDESTSPPIGSLNGSCLAHFGNFSSDILNLRGIALFFQSATPHATVACPHAYAVGCEPRHWERHEGRTKFMSSQFCVAGCFGSFTENSAQLSPYSPCLYLKYRIARPHVPAPNRDAPRTPTSYPCCAVTSPNNDGEKRHYNDDAVVAQLGLDWIS